MKIVIGPHDAMENVMTFLHSYCLRNLQTSYGIFLIGRLVHAKKGRRAANLQNISNKKIKCNLLSSFYFGPRARGQGPIEDQCRYS